MRLGEVRAVAAAWVATYAEGRPWFVGAHFAGSSVGNPDDMEWPATSDLDVVVLTDGPGAPPKPGKLRYKGALLDVSMRPWDRLRNSNQVLANHHLAPPFRVDSVISDPTRRLAALYESVAAEFSNPRWIRAHCASARSLVVSRLADLETGAWHERVMRWLFGTSTTTHVLLVAGLLNPTVRLRYSAVRNLLHDMGRAEVHETLLEHLGAASFTPSQVIHHIKALSSAMIDAAPVIPASFPFSSDLTDAGHAAALRGSADLVTAGQHREAVFWIAVTFARCRTVFIADGNQHAHAAEFDALLADLGLSGPGALKARSQQVLDYMPELDQLTDELIAAG